jgi:hypothetical protein
MPSRSLIARGRESTASVICRAVAILASTQRSRYLEDGLVDDPVHQPVRNDDVRSTVSDAIDALVDRLVETVLEEVRARLDGEPRDGLMKVSRAAAWLEVHPDHVSRLIHTGELVGFPFPDENSHIHVDVASLRELIRRRAHHQKKR